MPWKGLINASMTFELKINSDIYNKYGTDYSKIQFEDYIKTVYDRAYKLRDMRN